MAFMLWLMILNSLSIIVTVFVLCLYHKDPAPPVPPMVKKVIWNLIGGIVCYKPNNVDRASSQVSRNVVADHASHKHEHDESSINNLKVIL